MTEEKMNVQMNGFASWEKKLYQKSIILVWVTTTINVIFYFIARYCIAYLVDCNDFSW